MYSSEDIKQAIADGSLVIDPLIETSIRPGALGLHLGHRLLKPLPGKVVDVLNKITPDYDELYISDNAPYRLEPGEFLLAETLEKVSVATNLGFFIEGRSTLARVGLTVVQTAMMVYPGHRERAVTLELANHGPHPILLYAGMKIARAAIFELKTPTSNSYDDVGKYREQVTVGPPIFRDEIAKLK